MPRTKRVAPGGWVYHVLNRGVGRMNLFRAEDDYRAFLRVIGESLRNAPMRICGFCLMPNHWHLVLWPEADGDLARFMQRVTNTHVQRWQRHRRRVGEGHVYQGRYKSFPVQEDDHFYQLMRYVERNALRANLVERAEEWRWSSLATCKSDHPDETWPIAWPVRRPRGWMEYVNRVETEAELAAIRGSLKRGRPLGHASWVEEAASRLGLQSTLRDRGRPRKVSS